MYGALQRLHHLMKVKVSFHPCWAKQPCHTLIIFSSLMWFLGSRHHIDNGVMSKKKCDCYSLFLENKMKRIWKCQLEHTFLLTVFQPSLIEVSEKGLRDIEFLQDQWKQITSAKNAWQLVPCQKPDSDKGRAPKTRWDTRNTHFNFRRWTFFLAKYLFFKSGSIKMYLKEYFPSIHAAHGATVPTQTWAFPAAPWPALPTELQSCCWRVWLCALVWVYHSLVHYSKQTPIQSSLAFKII